MQVSKKDQSDMFYMEHPLIPSEEQECKTFYDYTQLIPSIREYTVHFANEGKRSLSFGRRLKRIGGIPKGFPDFCIFLPSNQFHSLYIEMKKRDGQYRKHPIEQLRWIERLNKAGHYAIMCFGAENAIQITQDYLANKL